MPRKYRKSLSDKQRSLLLFRERYKRVTGEYPSLKAMSVREGSSVSSVRKVLASALRNLENSA